MNVNNMLHSVASAAKTPVLWLLVFFLVITAFLLGSVLSEAVIRRRKKENASDFARLIENCDISKLRQLIERSGFTAVQKRAFIKTVKTADLPEAVRTETAQMLITETEVYYSRIINYTELIVKIAPMLGLMGTLIPLGPGITALGRGDMETLSQSITTAFDTTVAGLISGGFASVISSVRKLWYKKYIEDTQSIIEIILEKIQREEKENGAS